MDTINSVNRWYDSRPETVRMLIIPAFLIAAGGVNMALTIANGFPFGLLFLFALAAVIAIRAPVALLGMSKAAADAPHAEAATFKPQLEGYDWLYEANQRYETIPEERRVFIIPLVLIAVGGINMALTIGNGFPFGLLFLLALLGVVAFRAPFTAGWLKPPAPRPVAPPAPSVALAPAEPAPMAAVPPPAEPPPHNSAPGHVSQPQHPAD